MSIVCPYLCAKKTQKGNHSQLKSKTMTTFKVTYLYCNETQEAFICAKTLSEANEIAKKTFVEFSIEKA